MQLASINGLMKALGHVQLDLSTAFATAIDSPARKKRVDRITFVSKVHYCCMQGTSIATACPVRVCFALYPGWRASNKQASKSDMCLFA